MTHDNRTEPLDAAEIRAGHAVVIPGTGAFIVREIRTGGPTGRLALLAWDDLALMLRRGTTRDVLVPPGGLIQHDVDHPAGTRPSGPDGPTLPLTA